MKKLEKEEGIETKQAGHSSSTKILQTREQLFEKRQLVQPIQDKVFGAVQAVARKLNWNWSLTKVPKAVFFLSIRTRIQR